MFIALGMFFSFRVYVLLNYNMFSDRDLTQGCGLSFTLAPLHTHTRFHTHDGNSIEMSKMLTS